VVAPHRYFTRLWSNIQRLFFLLKNNNRLTWLPVALFPDDGVRARALHSCAAPRRVFVSVCCVLCVVCFVLCVVCCLSVYLRARMRVCALQPLARSLSLCPYVRASSRACMSRSGWHGFEGAMHAGRLALDVQS